MELFVFSKIVIRKLHQLRQSSFRHMIKACPNTSAAFIRLKQTASHYLRYTHTHKHTHTHTPVISLLKLFAVLAGENTKLVMNPYVVGFLWVCFPTSTESIQNSCAAGTNKRISLSLLLFLLYMQTHQGQLGPCLCVCVCLCASLNMCTFPTNFSPRSCRSCETRICFDTPCSHAFIYDRQIFYLTEGNFFFLFFLFFACII